MSGRRRSTPLSRVSPAQSALDQEKEVTIEDIILTLCHHSSLTSYYHLITFSGEQAASSVGAQTVAVMLQCAQSVADPSPVAIAKSSPGVRDVFYEPPMKIYLYLHTCKIFYKFKCKRFIVVNP